MRITTLSAWLFTLAALAVAPGAVAETEGEAELEYPHGWASELFVGGAYKSGENGFALGLGQGYRFHRYLAVGAVAERAAGDLKEWTFVFPLYIHPWRGLRLALGPGIEIEDSEAEFLIRVGLAYEIELAEHWQLLPEANVDFVDGHRAIVYGASIVYRW